jgi:transcriptional regulator with XRE-family HTH domain
MRQTLVAAFAAAPRGTQSRVADALGVRATAVNKWAKGYNVPEPQHWQQLEQLLDLPAGELTGEIGATRLDAAKRDQSRSPGPRRLCASRARSAAADAP